MFLNVLYDREASKIAGKMTFSSNEFVLQPHHILQWKNQGRLKLVDEDTFPENVPCQVLVQIEKYDTVKCMFFNPDFKLPAECYKIQFINRNLLERSQTYGGVWIEIVVPLTSKEFQLSMVFEKVE